MNHIQKLDALTSLRFIAAAMIVIGHAHPIFGSLGIANVIPLGQGVSFFFVLSGFILAYNYPQLDTLQAMRRFWLARFARVYPLHLVTCILWIALIFNFNREIYFPGYEGLGKLITNILLVQAWIPIKEWSLSFNGVSWSLSVEFFFYLCFPILITLWRKNWGWIFISLFCIVTIFIISSEAYNLSASDDFLGVSMLGTIYMNPAVRILEFCWGIAVASIVRSVNPKKLDFRNSQWLALELLTLLAIIMALLSAAAPAGIRNVLGEAAEYYYKREGLWLIWGALIFIFALSKGPISKLLSTRPLIYLGEISFALYLCHALVIHYIEPYTEQIQASGSAGYILFWIVLLLFSSLLFHGVEKPARELILSKSKLDTIKAIGKKHLPAVSLLVIFLGCTSHFSPSTIQILNEASTEEFLRDTSTISLTRDNPIFDGRYQLLGIRITQEEKSISSIEILLEAQKHLSPKDKIAVHLNDSDNKIIASAGDSFIDRFFKDIPNKTVWIHKLKVDTQAFNNSSNIGIAMYSNVSDLHAVSSSSSDWGGKRLIIPLPRLGNDNSK